MYEKYEREERFTLKKINLALLISKPGHLRNGLQSLLRTVPQIEIIAEAHDPSVLLQMSDELHPELILLDASIFEESSWFAITKFKAEWPQTVILVLTENDQQCQTAKEAGADLFIPKGFPAAELVNLIETALIADVRDEINHKIPKGKAE